MKDLAALRLIGARLRMRIEDFVSDLRSRHRRFRARKRAGPLSIDAYRAAIAPLPRPTLRQMEDFAQFVSDAHSWYKHLPLYPPGAAFHFFLDPSAGSHRMVDRDGTLRCFESDARGFHYSAIATAEYRRRFGHLAYCRPGGTSVELHLAGGQCIVPADEDLRLFDATANAWRPLPDEVLQAGCALASGLVHSTAALHADILVHFTENERARPPWPSESGGEATYAAIVDRVRALHEDADALQPLPRDHPLVSQGALPTRTDARLHALLEPEQRRQRRGMVEAMQRVLDTFHRPQGRHGAGSGTLG